MAVVMKNGRAAVGAAAGFGAVVMAAVLVLRPVMRGQIRGYARGGVAARGMGASAVASVAAIMIETA
jgi:hypothetical protein